MLAYNSLKEIDELLYKIGRVVSFSSTINPLNEKEEKSKFLSSISYDPVFKYAPYDPKLDYIAEVLEKLKVEDKTALGKIYQQKIDEFKLKIKLAKSAGDRNFTKYSEQLFGKPSDELVRIAERLKMTVVQKEDSFLSSDQVALRLKFALDKFGFDWKIKKKDMVAGAFVSHQDKILYIKDNCSFPRTYVKRLIIHEIGTHILRAENSKKQPYKIFEVGLAGYLMTEEGLAVLNEEYNNCLDKNTIKTYAGRVLAVNKAMKNSFRRTYDYLLPHFGEDKAWNLTMRAKRGIANTYWGGAYTKDYVYLQGYLKLKKFINDGGDISKLYYGRISLEHLGVIDEIPELINPLFLPGLKFLSTFTNEKKEEAEAE